ncbi:phage tail protein [Enterococcus cecorum]|uniref:phage tail protein n=1 Tax=Enterococcus cecorum TaxID=44008 RepID=UPI00148CCC11|nr:phage tail protein [Enterococcus cecorum]
MKKKVKVDKPMIAILDNQDHLLCLLDDYTESNLHTFLQGTAAFFKCSVVQNSEYSQYFKVGNKISFVWNDISYHFDITATTKNEELVSIQADSLTLELRNEDSRAYKASKAMTFKEYLDVFLFAGDNPIVLGINEVADKKLQLEWEGSEDSVLARLFSLANKFGAEIEFETVLNRHWGLDKIKLNVYREHDDKHQGIGKRRTDILLEYGHNIETIEIEENIDNLKTAIHATGKDGLTPASVLIDERDADGNRLYYSPIGDGSIRAVKARNQFMSKVNGEGYIAKNWTYETDNPNVLAAQALAELKKISKVEVTVKIKGYEYLGIGDTILAQDTGYNPVLNLEARISEQDIYFDNPENNTSTFTNVEILKSEVDESLLTRVRELIEENKVYDVQILTTNGYSFKNGQGSTTLTARVMDGPKDVTNEFSVNWYRENDLIGPDASITVQASSINEKVVYRIIAYKDGIERGRSELTLINVNDGKGGKDGASVFNFETNYQYKQSEINKYGTVGYRGVWNVIGDTSPVKVGDTVILSVFNTNKQSKSLIFATVNIVNSTSIDCTTTALVEKGEVGPPGLDGQQGKDGADGIPGRDGRDGRTSYAHIAYADSADGTKNFSVSDSHRLYIGFYTDFNATDSTNPSDYRWTLIKGADGQDGADGLPGKPGADGRTPYFHTAYADSADGQLGFSTTNASGKLYMGTCTDYIQSDPDDYRAYTWVKIKGDKGETGPAGRDGKGVKSYAITYQAGTSGVTYPTGNWSSTIPTVPKGQYLWSKTTLTYTDNTTSDTYSVAYFPVNGATGATGNGISSYTAEFYLSTSKSTQSGGSWTTTPPTWSNGKYIWTRYKIGYTNGSTAYTTPHCSSEWEAVNELQVGGRNLLKDTANFGYNGKPSGSGYKDGWLNNSNADVEEEKYNGLTVRSLKNGIRMKNICEYYFTGFNLGDTYTFSFWAKGTMNSFNCFFYGDTGYVRVVDILTCDGFSAQHVDGSAIFTNNSISPDKWRRLWVTWKLENAGDINIAKKVLIRTDLATSGDLYVCGPKLEKGNMPTDYSQAPEDTQDQIDQANINISNKVDQNAYNTDQITIWDSINSKMDDAEFRAFQSAMNALKSSYEGFVGEGGRFEKELQNATAREQEIVQDLGNKVSQLNFINTYIRESEEGIVIGAKNNPMQMLLSKDSLSFMDGGQVVAYFSNQSFYINRGAVVESLQVGVHKLTKIDNNHTVIQYIPQ